MGAKLSNLDELRNILTRKEKRDEGILIFSKQFNLGPLLRPFSEAKKKGYSLMCILITMLLSRFGGLSVYAAQKTGNLKMDDNTIYRLMNNELIDWGSMLLSFAKQFLKCVISKCEADEKAVRCFVIDDTDMEKTGKTFEGLSKIFSHKEHRYLFGFKLLLLCYWDGKSLIPCCLSLHRENKENRYGMSKKEQAKQFVRERNKESYFQERYDELDEEKPSVVLKMLKKSIKRGILANYVLMDSWFVTDFMLKGIREIRQGMLHVVGMCKMDRRKFEIDGQKLNSQALIKMNENNSKKVRSCEKYKSRYFIVNTNFKGTPVKLFYVKYKRAKDWKILLTTDLSLSFVKTMELYQIRWSIEVLFRETKQYLQLEKAQNTDFYGQIANATLTMITYTILALNKRFEDYESLGAVFRDKQKELLEQTLCERIEIVILKIVSDLLEILCVDVELTLYHLMSSNKANHDVIILLNAVNQLNSNPETLFNTT